YLLYCGGLKEILYILRGNDNNYNNFFSAALTANRDFVAHNCPFSSCAPAAPLHPLLALHGQSHVAPFAQEAGAFSQLLNTHDHVRLGGSLPQFPFALAAAPPRS